jgi:DNA-binding LytR/AlgR family response regulator
MENIILEQETLDARNNKDYFFKPVTLAELMQGINKNNSLMEQTITQIDDLKKIVELLRSIEHKCKENFLVTIGQKIRLVGVKEIAYFFFDEKITFLITEKDDRYIIDNSLENLVASLDPYVFFRVNRQLVVKRSAIENIQLYSKGRFQLTLKPDIGREIIVSGPRSEEFRRWLDF